jgi:hypothetical protein
MSRESKICVDCQRPFSFSSSEKARFDALMSSVTNFQMPKRCYECRLARRSDQPKIPVPMKPLQKPADAHIPPPKKNEVRLVLATTDFENLVAGRSVAWQGVTVILADIGYKAMHDAIDRVEQEKHDAKFNR